MKKVYLGDSVYAEFDGFHIVLTTDNGLGPSNTIYVEDSVFMALKSFGDKAFNIKGEEENMRTDGAQWY